MRTPSETVVQLHAAHGHALTLQHIVARQSRMPDTLRSGASLRMAIARPCIHASSATGR